MASISSAWSIGRAPVAGDRAMADKMPSTSRQQNSKLFIFKQHLYGGVNIYGRANNTMMKVLGPFCSICCFEKGQLLRAAMGTGASVDKIADSIRKRIRLYYVQRSKTTKQASERRAGSGQGKRTSLGFGCKWPHTGHSTQRLPGHSPNWRLFFPVLAAKVRGTKKRGEYK